MAVEAALRGKGIGQLFLDQAIAKTIPPCTVEVIAFGPDHPDEKAARRFYESFGFRPGPRRDPGPDGGSREAYVLRLLA